MIAHAYFHLTRLCGCNYRMPITRKGKSIFVTDPQDPDTRYRLSASTRPASAATTLTISNTFQVLILTSGWGPPWAESSLLLVYARAPRLVEVHAARAGAPP